MNPSVAPRTLGLLAATFIAASVLVPGVAAFDGRGDEPLPAVTGTFKKGADGRCSVRFTTPALRLTGKNRYARGSYRLAEDCSLIPGKVVYSESAPLRVALAPKTMKNESKPLPRSSGVVGTSSSFACEVNVWEEDVADIRMIGVTNHTSWSTDRGQIAEGRVDGRSAAFLDWWFLNGGIFVDIGFVREPYTAATVASQGFYCDGISICHGPSFNIVLRGDILFDGGGQCSGQASYDGLVVPAGEVLWEISR